MVQSTPILQNSADKTKRRASFNSFIIVSIKKDTTGSSTASRIEKREFLRDKWTNTLYASNKNDHVFIDLRPKWQLQISSGKELVCGSIYQIDIDEKERKPTPLFAF